MRGSRRGPGGYLAFERVEDQSKVRRTRRTRPAMGKVLETARIDAMSSTRESMAGRRDQRGASSPCLSAERGGLRCLAEMRPREEGFADKSLWDREHK